MQFFIIEIIISKVWICKGMRKGQIDTLVSLVNDGLLAISEAAKRAGLSEADFRVLMINR